MIQTIKQYLYKGYQIFQMHDAGAIWYEVELNGEFKGNYESYSEARGEIDKYEI